MKEDIASEAAVTRYKLAYAQHISFSVVRIAFRVKVSHSLNYTLKIFNFRNQLKGARKSARPAETWEITADDTPELDRPLGERPAGGASLR